MQRIPYPHDEPRTVETDACRVVREVWHSQVLCVMITVTTLWGRGMLSLLTPSLREKLYSSSINESEYSANITRIFRLGAEKQFIV